LASKFQVTEDCDTQLNTLSESLGPLLFTRRKGKSDGDERQTQTWELEKSKKYCFTQIWILSFLCALSRQDHQHHYHQLLGLKISCSTIQVYKGVNNFTRFVTGRLYCQSVWSAAVTT